jgi:hypothetical protein
VEVVFPNKQDKLFSKKQPQQETSPNQIARPIAKEYTIELEINKGK